MTVRRSEGGSIILEGVCPVEDAEPLLQMLQRTPTAVLDWAQCHQIHTAVLQVILASGIAPAGRCGDTWVAEWVASEVLAKTAGG